MKLVTFLSGGHQGEERLGAVIRVGAEETFVVDLLAAASLARREGVELHVADRVFADAIGLLRSGDEGLAAARMVLEWAARLRRGALAGLGAPLDGVKLLPPVPRPGKVICTGLNYLDHRIEGNLPTPSFPTGFIKLTDVLRGHDGTVAKPSCTGKFDYEAELCLVIGRECRDVPRERALDVVAGYTAFNDLTARDIALGEMDAGRSLMLGKNLDGFGPMGPFLVTKDEIPDPNDLAIQCRVNGQIRQSSRTSQLIFRIEQLIEHWSKVTLRPGDVISTGTPAGVGAYHKPDPREWLLKPGDVVEVEIEGIGILRTYIG